MAHRPGLALRRVTVAALLAAILVVVGPTSIARADGDPASDFLLANQVFLTSGSGALSAPQHQLINLVEGANRAGFTIRVAIISGTYDLGAVTELWRKPRAYASFLGQELTLGYKQRLLVVMPDGFGFNWPGHPGAAEYRRLANLQIKPGRDGLALSAQTAVRRLAAAAHITPAPSDQSAATSTRGATALVVIVMIGVGVVLAAAIVAVRARRRRSRLARRRRPVVRPRSLPLRIHLAIATSLVGCAAAAGVTILVTRGSRSSPSASAVATGAGPTGAQASKVVTAPPISWQPGQRRAPNFSLRDQSGGRVSLASYRGHEVIVTFIDPVCHNVCPLESKVLDQAVQRLPPTRRPEILAVSVNPYGDARANLLGDVRRWNLVPEWRWAVGSPAQLAGVWKRYRISVEISHQHVADRTITSITHTVAAFVVDASGHERALFIWPFYPQDVAHVLRQLA